MDTEGSRLQGGGALRREGRGADAQGSRLQGGGALSMAGPGGDTVALVCEVGQSAERGGQGTLWHCACEVGVVATGQGEEKVLWCCATGSKGCGEGAAADFRGAGTVCG